MILALQTWGGNILKDLQKDMHNKVFQKLILQIIKNFYQKIKEHFMKYIK